VSLPVGRFGLNTADPKTGIKTGYYRPKTGSCLNGCKIAKSYFPSCIPFFISRFRFYSEDLKMISTKPGTRAGWDRSLPSCCNCLLLTLLYLGNFTPSHLLPYSRCSGFPTSSMLDDVSTCSFSRSASRVKEPARTC
jgi:hypothetical protein